MRAFFPASIRAGLCALALACAALFPVARADVPEAVQARLARGINLSFWFTYRGDPKIDPLLFQPDAADLAALRRVGFRHVRIAFDHAWLADAKNEEQLNPAHAAEFVQALQLVAAHDLLSVVTFSADDDYRKRLLADDATLKHASGFWWNLAKLLSAKLKPDQLVFEVLNEPGTPDAARSAKIMQTLAGAVRDAAPAHTLVIGGSDYSKTDELVALTPFLDKNLVYTFHFYDPINFTHQGATWGWPPWAKFHDFPYPSSPEAVAPILDKLDAEARPHAQFYGEQRWNRDKLAAILDKVGDWQKKNGVPVWCGEFGAVKTYAPPGARAAWLRDTRELLEERHIAWTHFDFTQHFGIVDGPQGARVWDKAAIKALGLTPP